MTASSVCAASAPSGYFGPNDELPGVSVVIPAYNYGRFLNFAVDSALNQTYKSLEIIVVDDGSTDNTKDILAAYGNRVRYVYQQNAGLSAARNTGIRAASHSFVAFLDADDQFETGLVESAMRKFKELPETFGLVACSSRYIDEHGSIIPIKFVGQKLTGEITSADLLLMTRFSPSGVVVRKSVFRDCGYFDKTLRSSEDRDMWIRVSTRYQLYLQREELALIRRHGNNMSSNADRMRSNMQRVLWRSYCECVAPRWRLVFWLRVISIWLYQTALIYQGTRRPFSAFRDACLSLICWPFWLPSREINSTIRFLRLRLLARICLHKVRR